MVAKSRILAARAVFNALLQVLILGGLACLPLPGAAAAARIEARQDLIHIDGQPLFLKGIDYNPYLCGDSPGTANLRVDFRSDLRQMKENLYANTVRVYGPMPRAFYEAAREMRLWVIQGIYISDAGAAEAPRGL